MLNHELPLIHPQLADPCAVHQLEALWVDGGVVGVELAVDDVREGAAAGAGLGEAGKGEGKRGEVKRHLKRGVKGGVVNGRTREGGVI